MQSITDTLELPPGLTPHCLRAGGASNDEILCIPRDKMKQRVRWCEDASMKRYLRPKPLKSIMTLLTPTRRTWWESIFRERQNLFNLQEPSE